MSLVYPLIAWGAAEDISAAPWTNIGVPTVTGGQADPFGGTGAYLIDDNNPAGSEGRARTTGTLAVSRATVFPMARAGTATVSAYILVETAGFVSKLDVRFTWSGGVPTVSIVTGGANATLHGTIALGGGWYGALVSITGLTAGAAHEHRCYGAVPGASPTAVGTTYWYLRNVVLLEAPKGPVSWDDQREGSEIYDGLDGLADAYLRARDYRFRGDIPLIPTAPRGVPQLMSGWEGANESIGVNAGVEAMLKAGQDARTLVFAPDRSTCAVNISSELVHPIEGDEVTPMPDGSRGITLELRNPTSPYPGLL
jgi:hypothetical protein